MCNFSRFGISAQTEGFVVLVDWGYFGDQESWAEYFRYRNGYVKVRFSGLQGYC
jgi:hypothetical protein